MALSCKDRSIRTMKSESIHLSENLRAFADTMREYDEKFELYKSNNDLTVDSMSIRDDYSRECMVVLQSFLKRDLPEYYTPFVSIIQKRLEDIREFSHYDEEVFFCMVAPLDNQKREEAFKYN
jgi:hypothetical protein